MSNRDILIGIVRDGKFYTLPSEPPLSSPTLLTKMRMMESIPPETKQLRLDKYEGKTIAVEGHNQGSIVYDAHIIDVGGYIVTRLVLNAFGNPPGF